MFKYLLITAALVLTAQAKEFHEDFERVKAQQLPSGWKAQMTDSKTNSAVWKVQKEKENHILTLTEFTKGDRGPFNLCFTDKVDFQDGEISVRFRANSGNIDQGGGLMWRVQDRDNYYVARFNPLEDNFRFYRVKEGHRGELKSSDIHLKKGWHTMKIIQKAKHFEGYIDGKKLLECDDDSIQKSGGVGVWSKADAATSFDDFKVSY